MIMKTLIVWLTVLAVATASDSPTPAPTVQYSNCRLTRDGREYVGSLSTTKGGYTCQRWDLQTPQTHSQTANRFASRNLTVEENFCRNPDGEKEPWCYTTDANKRWEYCDIPRCGTSSPSPAPTRTPTADGETWSPTSAPTQAELPTGVFRTECHIITDGAYQQREIVFNGTGNDVTINNYLGQSCASFISNIALTVAFHVPSPGLVDWEVKESFIMPINVVGILFVQQYTPCDPVFSPKLVVGKKSIFAQNCDFGVETGGIIPTIANCPKMFMTSSFSGTGFHDSDSFTLSDRFEWDFWNRSDVKCNAEARTKIGNTGPYGIHPSWEFTRVTPTSAPTQAPTKAFSAAPAGSTWTYMLPILTAMMVAVNVIGMRE